MDTGIEVGWVLWGFGGFGTRKAENPNTRVVLQMSLLLFLEEDPQEIKGPWSESKPSGGETVALFTNAVGLEDI